jgi:AsmA protein
VGSLEGQGGEKGLQGLGVPVAITGAWTKPSIYPDIAGILENPQAAYERLSKLGGGLVNLPSASSLGDTLGGKGGIADLVKEKAGASIDNLIQADQGTEQQGVVKGLGQFLGGQLGTPAPAEPAASQPEEPRKKKVKKKQAEAVVETPAQQAPKLLMQNLLGSFQ